MSAETAFAVASFGVMPAWALLVFAPRWKWTRRLVQAIWLPLLLGLAHSGLLFLVASPPEGANAATLEGAVLLFRDPWTTVVCWIHYLAFDLFVGAWEVRDAVRRKLPHWAVAPCVVLTWLMGPMGLLAYLTLRFFLRRTVTLEEEPEAATAPSEVSLERVAHAR